MFSFQIAIVIYVLKLRGAMPMSLQFLTCWMGDLRTDMQYGKSLSSTKHLKKKF